MPLWRSSLSLSLQVGTVCLSDQLCEGAVSSGVCSIQMCGMQSDETCKMTRAVLGFFDHPSGLVLLLAPRCVHICGTNLVTDL